MAPNTQRVLVVDDDPIVHQVLKHYLERAGYEITMARSGNEAIEAAQRELPQLIIMDVLMPEMDGLEAVRRLKTMEATKAIPVIVLTASALRLTELESAACGAEAFFTKPFSEGAFLAAVQRLAPPSTGGARAAKAPGNPEPSVDEKLRFIFERRSIRVYAPGEVSEQQVQRLLAAAMAAPSAAAKYPWRFVVVRERQTLSRMAAALPYGQMLAEAALGIAVCGDLEAVHDGQLSYLLQDCSAAIENLLLCAHILGLGACWIGVHPREERLKSVKEILALPVTVVPVACIAVGHPGESKEPHAKFESAWVHQEKWSGAQARS